MNSKTGRTGQGTEDYELRQEDRMWAAGSGIGTGVSIAGRHYTGFLHLSARSTIPEPCLHAQRSAACECDKDDKDKRQNLVSCRESSYCCYRISYLRLPLRLTIINFSHMKTYIIISWSHQAPSLNKIITSSSVEFWRGDTTRVDGLALARRQKSLIKYPDSVSRFGTKHVRVKWSVINWRWLVPAEIPIVKSSTARLDSLKAPSDQPIISTWRSPIRKTKNETMGTAGNKKDGPSEAEACYCCHLLRACLEAC